MATAKTTDRRPGRGRLLAGLAAVGLLIGAAAAGEVRAQDVYDRGYPGYADMQRTAYFQNGRRGPGGYGAPGRYGPPPGYGAAPGYPGGGGFRRGQVLPPDQRDRYVDDPGRYHLRAPPNGYGWVGDGRNAYLMQRSTGMVLDSVPGAYEPGPRMGGRGGRGYEGRGGGRMQEGAGRFEGGGGRRGRNGR